MNKIIQISTSKNGWNEAMYHQKCTCGHMLYEHAFTFSGYNEHSEAWSSIRVSQCVVCAYDYENHKFECDVFTRALEE